MTSWASAMRASNSPSAISPASELAAPGTPVPERGMAVTSIPREAASAATREPTIPDPPHTGIFLFFLARPCRRMARLTSCRATPPVSLRNRVPQRYYWVVTMRIRWEGDAFDPECPTRIVLDRVGDKWTVLIVDVLDAGPKRFNEIRLAIGGITPKVLTSTLRSLVA